MRVERHVCVIAPVLAQQLEGATMLAVAAIAAKRHMSRTRRSKRGVGWGHSQSRQLDVQALLQQQALAKLQRHRIGR